MVGEVGIEPFAWTALGSYLYETSIFTVLPLEESGGRGRSRTCDRLVRSQVLYPAELRALMNYYLYLSLKIANFRSTQALFFIREIMAEREGFEPSNGFKAVTPLAGERLRPLGHLSNSY